MPKPRVVQAFSAGGVIFRVQPGVATNVTAANPQGKEVVSLARRTIEIALVGLRQYIMPTDRPFLLEIEALIGTTQYPYKIGSEKLDLLGKIIRDADLAQALSSVWIQQVVIGLAQEWGVTPLEALRKQVPFLAGLRFSTEWAGELFPPEFVQAKIEEAEQLLQLLESEATSAAAITPRR